MVAWLRKRGASSKNQPRQKGKSPTGYDGDYYAVSNCRLIRKSWNEKRDLNGSGSRTEKASLYTDLHLG